MNTPKSEIKKNLINSLEQFLSERDEKSRVSAYEFGRSASSLGLGELELISLYQEIINLKPQNGDLESLNMELALDFLSECLAPYEMKQRGFQDLIAKQEAFLEQLQDEIKQRKESEEKLRVNKEHFQHLIENALDIITILNFDGTIRYESPSIKRILGYEPSEISGTDVINYIHPDDVDLIKSKLLYVMAAVGNMDTAEFRFKHKDGSWRNLESIAKNVIDPKEGPGVIVNSRDITDRVKAWEKLQQSEKQLSAAQKIGKLGSWEWDVQQSRLTWSDELRNIYGIGVDEYPRSYNDYLQLIHPEDRDKADQTAKKAVEENKPFGFEHRITRADGEVRILYGRGEAILDSKGELIKLIGTSQDITEIKETEQKLRQYSKQLRNLTAKQEKVREEERIRIAREIHDELGQMLTVLKMDASMAIKKRKQTDVNIVAPDFLNEISNIINRIDTIIQSVQRITTELRPEILDDLGLEEALEWHAEEFQKWASVKLEFVNNSESINRMDADRSTAVFRIFQETLTNIMRHAKASKVKVDLDEDEQYLILNVHDNGTGITRNEIEHSDSLGIVGMRERCQLLGGNIEFSGKPGQGTTVTLKIPLQTNKI